MHKAFLLASTPPIEKVISLSISDSTSIPYTEFKRQILAITYSIFPENFHSVPFKFSPIPKSRSFITAPDRVLQYAHQGSFWLVVVITLINGVAEEAFFRGALYTALGRRAPVAISTLLYLCATLASGNPMLGFAAVILGTVCALERRASGGILAPMLTHFFWGLVMVLALPPIFGV